MFLRLQINSLKTSVGNYQDFYVGQNQGDHSGIAWEEK